jgi:predicted SAM-dependent methyltransferase
MIAPSLLKNLLRGCPPLERLAAQIVNHRYRIARRHLHGIGLEIGALNRRQVLPAGARAIYLDRFYPRHLREHYPELGKDPFFVSLVADGETLACVRDESLDFVIANHVIEHCEDPVATLQAFAARLRSGGVIFMAVPDMRRTFDRDRTETTWEQLLQDHERGPAISRAAHFREWAQQVEKLSGDAAARRAHELEAMNYSIHFHCWTRAGFQDFIEHLSEMTPLTLLESAEWRDENIFVLKKS